MTLILPVNSSSVILPIRLTDSAGDAATAVAHDAAGLSIKWKHIDTATWSDDVTLSAGTLGTYSSGGWVASTGGEPGRHFFGLPALAINPNSATILAVTYDGVTREATLWFTLPATDATGQVVASNAQTGAAAAITAAGIPTAVWAAATRTLTAATGVILNLTGRASKPREALQGDTITLVQHEQHTEVVPIVDDNGDPVDLTGVAVRLTVSREIKGDDIRVFDIDGTPGDGTATFTFSVEDTAIVREPRENYKYSVDRTPETGAILLRRGAFVVQSRANPKRP